jgi:hypothetical protein
MESPSGLKAVGQAEELILFSPELSAVRHNELKIIM